MDYPKGALRKVQKFVAFKTKERGLDDETLHERLLLLTEELGELVKAVRKTTNMPVSEHSKTYAVGEELADVLIMLLAVASKLDKDLEKEHMRKEKEIDKRTYKRSK